MTENLINLIREEKGREEKTERLQRARGERKEAKRKKQLGWTKNFYIDDIGVDGFLTKTSLTEGVYFGRYIFKNQARLEVELNCDGLVSNVAWRLKVMFKQAAVYNLLYL